MQKLSFMLVFLTQTRFHCWVWTGFAVVADCAFSYSRSRCVVLMTEGGGRVLLCIKLLGWGFLIGCARGFPLSQVVAALVLLPHAVNQEEDEEDGEQEADDAACDNSWGETGRKEVRINAERSTTMDRFAFLSQRQFMKLLSTEFI